jgi:hypothetical protein
MNIPSTSDPAGSANVPLPLLRRVLVPLLLVAIVLLLFLPMLDHWSFTGDFTPHGDYVQRMLNHDPTVLGEVPNFLFHIPVAFGLMLLPDLGLPAWMAITSLGWYLLLAFIYLWLVRGTLTGGESLTLRGMLVTLIAPVALMLLTPIMLFTPENMYFGYLHAYVYHNPTMIPLRPTSVLLFVAAARVFQKNALPLFASGQLNENQNHFSVLNLGLVVALTLACILAKPSFVMTLLPALGAMTLAYLVMRHPINWALLVVGIGIPAVALLGYQALTFTDGGLEIAPFLTFDLWAYHYNPLANTLLPLKFLLSIAFPLVLYLAYFQQARRDVAFNLAWLCFAVGAAWTYLFADSGDRVAGNLVWNGQSALLILYVAAVLFWLRQNPWLNAGKLPRSYGRFVLCGVVFALHLASGMVWYAIHLNAVWPEIVYVWW